MSEDNEGGMSLTPAERNSASVLIVEPDPNFRQNLRTSVKNLGYGAVTDVSNHMAGVERVQDRKITHVVFDARETNMAPKEFLGKILELEEESICIPTSFEPNVDDVFDMLIQGAKGYLVKPFTIDTVDASLIAASKGEPIHDSVKQAKDRNEALVAIVMASLDKTATLMRQARQFETARVEIPRALLQFKRTSELAHMFAKGGEEGLIEAIEKFCLERSKGPATRLGRLRKRLKTSPSSKEDDDSKSAGA